MASSKISAVLFALEQKKVATFYLEVLGPKSIENGENYDILSFGDFNLTIFQIPKKYVSADSIEQPPRPRVEGAIKLCFPVESIIDSRKVASTLGGKLDDSPPEWASEGENIYLGYDPEGNVFQVSEKSS